MDRRAARDADGAHVATRLSPIVDEPETAGLRAPLVVERCEGSAPACLALRRTAGASGGPVRWSLLYGGVAIDAGWLSAGEASESFVASGLEDWMEDRALSLRARGDGDGPGVEATCLRSFAPRPTRAEATARARWSRLQGGGTIPSTGSRCLAGSRRVAFSVPSRPETADVPSPLGPGAPLAPPGRRTRRVNVYRGVSGLLAARRGSTVRDDGLEPRGDRPAPGER